MSDERVTRHMVFAGQRLNGPKIVHCWYDEHDVGGQEYWWDKLKGVSIGGIYTVESPADNLGSVFTGSLTYTGERIYDTDLIAVWQARDWDARSTAQLHKAERRHGKSEELERALEPLLRLVRGSRTRHDAFAIQRLASERIIEEFYKK